MDIMPDIQDIPNIKLAEIKFQILGTKSEWIFAYDDVQFALASPQHSIAGFSIDLDPTQGISFNMLIRLTGSSGTQF